MAAQESYSRKLREMENDNQALRGKLSKEQQDHGMARNNIGELERKQRNMNREI